MLDMKILRQTNSKCRKHCACMSAVRVHALNSALVLQAALKLLEVLLLYAALLHTW